MSSKIILIQHLSINLKLWITASDQFRAQMFFDQLFEL